MGKTGELCYSLGEVKLEWKIKDFLLLSDMWYQSTEFYFSGESWEIWIYPNDDAEDASEGWIHLFVRRVSSGRPVTVDLSLSLKTVDGKTDILKSGRLAFDETECRWGFKEVIKRSKLIERQSELLPSGALTVICTFKNSETSDADGNEDSEKVDRDTQTEKETGVGKLQQHLREILLNGNVSDVVLKVDDREFKSHRSILAARSPVFLAMMTHETKEKNTGVVDIPDVDPDTFSDFLNYLYTENVECMTSQNVVKLYTAADKYQVDELKNLCIDFMLKNMSVDSFCDVLTLSLRHVEKELTDACSQFFIENSLAIVLTPAWQLFLSENPVAGNELYIKSYKSLSKSR